MNEFVGQLLAEMTPMLDLPFAFFGHCLGGLTMYETARRLVGSSNHRPIHLFASGARPPDALADIGPFEERLTNDLLALAEFRANLPAHLQPDDVFADIVRHFDMQATDRFLDDPELRRLMLPVVRAEFQMVANYTYTPESPWEIPITCFANRGDTYVSRQHALGWGRFTNTRLQVHIRKGDHYSIVDDVKFIQTEINRELRA
jgi:epothilone polyketide synthase C